MADKKYSSVENYCGLLGIAAIGVLVGAQLVRKFGDTGEIIAIIVSCILVVSGFIVKKKAHQK